MNIPNAYACVLFDLYSALVRRIPDPLERMEKALRKHNVAHTRSQLKQLQAYAAEMAVRSGADTDDERMVWHLMAFYAGKMFADCPPVTVLNASERLSEGMSCTLQAGAWETLSALKLRGIRVGAVCCEAWMARRMLEELAVAPFVDEVFIAQAHSKTHADFLQNACSHLGTTMQDGLFVTAHPTDALHALEAGMDAAWLISNPWRRMPDGQSAHIHCLRSLSDLIS